MKVLLHVCCGPCATYCVDKLRTDGHEVYGYFYNPNIHPYTEHQKRWESLIKLSGKADFTLIGGEPSYDMRDFLRQVSFREETRCRVCYNMRLSRTAHIARKGKFDAFTSTLLISPFQNQELIIALGEDLAQKYGVQFLSADFREGFKESIRLSKEYGLYRQQYCGCIYSEEDRYRKKRN